MPIQSLPNDKVSNIMLALFSYLYYICNDNTYISLCDNNTLTVTKNYL